MGSKKTVVDYINEVSSYLSVTSQLVGKPQKLKVVGNTLFWTQGKEQKLFQWPISGTPEGPVAKPVFAVESQGSGTKLSKAEELLRERMRNLLTGISSFLIRESDDAVFYTTETKLFIYYTTGPLAHRPPLDVFSFIKDQEKFLNGMPFMHISHVQSSKDLTDVVFVHNNNLYSAHITEQTQNEETPLMVEVTAVTTIGDDLHQCGVADYIIQEEFDRYTGHYENEDYILFSYIDTSMMRKVSLLRDDSVEEMPYPRVGDVNSKTTIVVYDRNDQTYRYLPECVLKKSIAFEPEYIPRFGFKKRDTIYVQVLSRTQEECATLSYPIDSLVEITEKELLEVYSGGCGKTKEFFAPMHVEMEQSIPWGWVEITPKAPILFGKRFDVAVRHADETDTAHYHLYVRPAAGSATSWKPITTGAWNVNPGYVMVHGDRIIFVANASSRLQQGLFTLTVPNNLYDDFVPFDEAEIIPVSQEGEFVHPSFQVHEDKVFYCASTATGLSRLRATTMSDSVEAAPRECFTIPSEDWITARSSSDEIPNGQPSCGGIPVTLPVVATVKNSRGVPISGAVYIPPQTAPSLETEAGMPLVVYVYGGPHVQLIHENNFESYLLLAVQCLVLQGIAVAVVDNQMSNANGLRALSVCKKNMGYFETSDYVAFVKELCSAPLKLGLPASFKVDPSRVGIFGWSYGGYATLLAMSQAPDVFKMGFSGAPVGDWTLYDTGYTERYMGTLKDSKTGQEPSEAYEKSKIGFFAAGFPDEIDRVYIAHGLLDENVHFVNSCHIISAFVAHGKPYNMLMYPGERHGLRQNPQSRFYHDAIMIKTFVEKL
eukprot:gene5164-3712_t